MPSRPRHLDQRGRLAVRALRSVNATSRALGRGSGTVAGGRVALGIDHDILRKLLRGRDVVLVSGTNGKTTTTALVRAALGVNSASNITGANMAAGIVAALANDNTATCVLEVDEPWLPTVMDAAADAASRSVVLLNLSRDQLDRASEVRQLAQRWQTGITKATQSASWRVIANVADPLIAYAVRDVSNVIACAMPMTWRSDAVSCPVCTRPLVFTSDTPPMWTCTCGFAPPTPAAVFGDTLHVEGRSVPLQMSLPGRFNESNAAMAVVAAHALDVSLADAADRVSRVTSVAGRFDVRRWGERTFRLLLAKNPAGVEALIETVAAEGRPLVVSINANLADGRDPSWLYDAPFQRLQGATVWCDGSRALDLATRLDYAGVAAQLVTDDATFPHCLPDDAVIDVIANYTAFAQWLKKSVPC